jgi:hypothetical protein
MQGHAVKTNHPRSHNFEQDNFQKTHYTKEDYIMLFRFSTLLIASLFSVDAAIDGGRPDGWNVLAKAPGYLGCSAQNPCEQCRGYCNFDSHCRDVLVCKQREDIEPVPGCIGDGVSGRGYCHHPDEGGYLANRYYLNDSPVTPCSATTPCERCQGTSQ